MIEILIGMAIAMLTILIMMQAMSVAEGYRRNATSGGDAQSNGAIAMYLVQREMRLAGYGFMDTQTGGAIDLCTSGVTLANNNGFAITFGGGLAPPFAPFVINPPGIPAGDAGSDIVEIVYSGSDHMIGTGIDVEQVTSDTYNVDTRRGGFRQGDMILVAGVASGANTCSIAEITSLPQDGFCGDPVTNNPGDGSYIVHAVSGTPYYNIYYNQCGGQLPGGSKWNATASQPNFVGKAKAYNLGPRPDLGPGLAAKIYAVRNGRLTACDMLTQVCTAPGSVANTTVWVPIADDIVAIRASYGMDDGAGGTAPAGDGVVDSWVQGTPATVAQWKQLRAGRIAFVSRGKQFEKTPVTTVSALNWADGTAMFNLSTLPATSSPAVANDWQYYRYRTFETKVPFRNMIWN